jgi:putative membrane protein
MDLWIPELFFGFVSIFFFVGFWWIVIMVIARLLRRNGGPSPSTGIQILEERYARGEISREEFLERRSVLLGG